MEQSRFESQTMPAMQPAAVYAMEPHLLSLETLPTTTAKVLDVRPVSQQSVTTVAMSPSHQDVRAQADAERDVFIRSMQETHTLQIRMLEELIEQKVNKALDSVSMVSSQCEERFAHVEAYIQDMRRDMDSMHEHLMKLDAHVGQDQGKNDLLNALGNVHTDMEKVQNQHQAHQSSIQAQNEQHQHLYSLHEELRQRLDSVVSGYQPQDGQAGERHMQLQAELSELRHEINMLGSNHRQHGSQLQELEGQVVQHLRGLKEQQQSDAMLLRQDLEATLAASNNGEGMMELHRKYEEVSRAVEVALRELPPVRQAAPHSGPQDSLEVERQERARDIDGLSSLIQEERDERIRVDEELDARQQQAAQETFNAVNQAFDEFRAEMKALADQMLRQGPDRAEIESMVTQTLRSERDVRSEFTRFFEDERAARVQDQNNERDARIRESTDLRAAIQRLADKMTVGPDVAELAQAGAEGHVEFHNDILQRLQTLSQRLRALEVASEEHIASVGQEMSKHQALVQRDIGELRSSKADRAEHASHVATVSRDLGELRERSRDLAGTRDRGPALDFSGDLADMRAGLGQLRGQVDSLAARGPAHPSPHPDLDRLAAALEAETASRCEADAELHHRLTRESAELAGRVELLSQDLSTKSREVVVQGPSPEATKAALQQEVLMFLERERTDITAVITAEQAARLRDVSDCRSALSQALERERTDRTANCDDIRLDLMKAVACERDERCAGMMDQRAEIAKIVQNWHRGSHSQVEVLQMLEAAPAPGAGQASQVSVQAVGTASQGNARAEPAEQLSFMSRIFRKGRAAE